MLASAILLSVAIGHRATVDFEVRATSLTNALEKLSRTAGVELRPEASMANEIVCVKAHKVAVEDLLGRIAEATGCEWKQENGTRILFRSPEATQKCLDREYAARVAYIRKLFDPKAKELANIPRPYERAQAFVQALKALQDKIAEHPTGVNLDGPRLAAPASTLVLQLALDLGPEVLAQVPDGDTYTFANRTTRVERPLGPKANGYIADYLESETQLGNLLPEKPDNKGMMAGQFDDVYESSKMTDGVGKVLLTAHRIGRFLSLGVASYTERGKQRSWGFTNTYQLGDNLYAKQQQAGISDKPVWVELSPLSAEFTEAEEPQPDVFMPGDSKSKPWTSLSSSCKKALQNPEEIDPLSLAVTDGCFALADQSSVPMVAYLEDGSVSAGRLAAKGGRLNLARFKALLKNGGHYVDVKDNWLVIKPWYPLSPPRYRLSRPALGKFMRAAVAAGGMEFQPYCRFHFEGGQAMTASSVNRLYTKTLIRWGISPLPLMESHPHETFACLGSLADSQWQNLLRGAELRVGQMPQAQRTAADGWMKSGYGLKVEPDVADLYHNWTEYAENGLPPGATLSLEPKTQYVYRNLTKVQYPDGSMHEEYVGSEGGDSPETIAKAYAEGGYYKSLDQCIAGMRAVGKFEVAVRTDVTARLRLLPTHTIEETFRGTFKNSKSLGYDEWPEAMRRTFEDTFRKYFKGEWLNCGNDSIFFTSRAARRVHRLHLDP